MRFLLPVFCCLTLTAFGQDTTQLTNNFIFENGVYLTLTDLQQNKPKYDWSEIEASAHINREKQVIRLEYLNVLDSTATIVKQLKNNEIWGICVGGIPYISVKDTFNNQIRFVALRTRGKYCYYQYSSYEMREVPMTIYDPETGKAIWVQSIENKEAITIHKMLDFETGKTDNLKLANFKSWVKDDAQLTNTINDMSDAEIRRKLYKMLLIYNDRNPYFIIGD